MRTKATLRTASQAPGALVWRIRCAFIVMTAGALAASSPPAKRVLMLFSEGMDLPANVMVDRAAKPELVARSANRLEFDAEHLDASRLPGESPHRGGVNGRS